MAMWTTNMLLIVVASLLAMSAVNAALIDIVNQCGDTITACSQSGSNPANCYVLNGGGGTQEIDVGSSLINSQNNGVFVQKESELEFTSEINTCDDQDNEAMSITLTSIASGGSPSAPQHCEPISCIIPNLSSFCQPPTGTLTGPPGDGCYNTDGPGTVPTPQTQAWKNACPDAYSYSKDDDTPTYTCGTGTNYVVTFCPPASV